MHLNIPNEVYSMFLCNLITEVFQRHRFRTSFFPNVAQQDTNGPRHQLCILSFAFVFFFCGLEGISLPIAERFGLDLIILIANFIFQEAACYCHLDGKDSNFCTCSSHPRIVWQLQVYFFWRLYWYVTNCLLVSLTHIAQQTQTHSISFFSFWVRKA